MMNRKRYILFPGKVMSSSDGQIHNVSTLQLLKLYKVPFAECRSYPESIRKTYIPQPGDIILRPDYSGKYTLPEAETEATCAQYKYPQ